MRLQNRKIVETLTITMEEKNNSEDEIRSEIENYMADRIIKSLGLEDIFLEVIGKAVEIIKDNRKELQLENPLVAAGAIIHIVSYEIFTNYIPPRVLKHLSGVFLHTLKQAIKRIDGVMGYKFWKNMRREYIDE
jgi:hypothetical protein